MLGDAIFAVRGSFCTGCRLGQTGVIPQDSQVSQTIFKENESNIQPVQSEFIPNSDMIKRKMLFQPNKSQEQAQ